MGQPKLLLALRGKSLVRRVVEEAVASRAKQTVVVTGAYRAQIERELAGLPIKLVHNPEHAAGMSTSLRAGLKALRPETDAAIILLGDQPLVDHSVLDALIETYEHSGRSIVRPSYAGRRGNPVLWDRRLFDELMAQEGDQGGRALLRRHASEVATREIPDARLQLDVDTRQDYERLLAEVEAWSGGSAPASHDHELQAPRFCPVCAGRLEPSGVQDRLRPVCTVCGAVFYVDPKVAVAVLVPWQDGVLLGRRAIDPGRGVWSFPSGYVDRGEVLEEAAQREVLEETGLQVDIGGLVGVYSAAGDPVILVAYAGEVRAGVAAPGPEMSELAGFPVDQLPRMAFGHDDRIVGDWMALRQRQAARS